MSRGGVLFKCSERQLKNGVEWHKYLFRFIKWHLQFCRNNVFLLCASAFTSYDYAKFGVFLDKAYKWGYFPDFNRYSDISEILSNKKKNSLLWVGRFVDWKHPEYAILAVKSLLSMHYECTLTMVGSGPMEEYLKNMVHEYSLEANVVFTGSVQSSKVRKYMEDSEVFLFTSDAHEGWGAVLNEAMNSGCLSIAGSMIGSVPYLISDEYNGLVFQSENLDDFLDKVNYVFSNRELINTLGTNAYNTIKDGWNAGIAADRFLKLADYIIKNSDSKERFPFDCGICSRAEIIKA